MAAPDLRQLASGLAKPDGLLVVPDGEVVGFVQQLPVAALWGVGDRTEEVLLQLGLRTVGDIAHTPLETLQRALGDAAGAHLHDLSWGRDPRRVQPSQVEKSIGSDETFPYDVDDPAVIQRELLRLADRTAARVRSAGMAGRTVTIRVRFADFTSVTRDITLPAAVGSAREIRQAARQCLKRIIFEQRMRLLGVRASGLQARVPVMTQGDQGELPL